MFLTSMAPNKTDFMDAWNNVVEVGAVKVSLYFWWYSSDSDANETYTVTGLVGNGDGEGEANQKPGEGLNLIITRNGNGLISNIKFIRVVLFSHPNETVTVASSKINDVTDLNEGN